MTTTPVRPPDAGTVRRWRRHLADERLEAAVYRELAAKRDGEEQAILTALAEAEARHAAHWEALLTQHGHTPAGRASVRAVVLVALARRFGSVFVLALAQRAEGRSPYGRDRDATRAMAADEQIHEEVVRGLAARGRARVSGTFRAAVFGANDGLVSNLALVLGVAAGGATSSSVLLTGLAGLLAGALSMGAGEFVSVRSQRELLEASSPGRGTRDVVPHLDVDANELALVYRARGFPPEQAQARAAAQLAAWTDDDPGDDHDDVGTGWAAALSSFCFFATGAAVPVLPFAVGLEGGAALAVACLLVGLALLMTGATVGMLSGGPPLRRALRQLAVGAGAAAVTYVLGLAFGATLG
ncbi:MAG: protein of unknown function DUF125,transrane [Frankiales bacterium]|nr:protein of unknown function DUF125,transrane [Frankiales bacterium]